MFSFSLAHLDWKIVDIAFVYEYFHFLNRSLDQIESINLFIRIITDLGLWLSMKVLISLQIGNYLYCESFLGKSIMEIVKSI